MSPPGDMISRGPHLVELLNIRKVRNVQLRPGVLVAGPHRRRRRRRRRRGILPFGRRSAVGAVPLAFGHFRQARTEGVHRPVAPCRPVTPLLTAVSLSDATPLGNGYL